MLTLFWVCLTIAWAYLSSFFILASPCLPCLVLFLFLLRVAHRDPAQSIPEYSIPEYSIPEYLIDVCAATDE